MKHELNASGLNAPAKALSATPFQWRALTSVSITLCFLLLVVSGVVLWAAPPGRIANWTNWNMLGFRKSEWIELHLWFSLIFVAGSIFHLVLNWRPLLGYFKSKLTRQFGLRREWLAAGILCSAVFAGTRLGVPPFSSFLSFTENFRSSWEQTIERPPIPHAELLTVRELAEKAGVPLSEAQKRLESRSIQNVSPEIRMAELAKLNRLPAQELYKIMTTDPAGSGQGRGQGKGYGGGAGGGAGQKTLTQFCLDEGLDLKAVQARLEAKGIKSSPQTTLREIAVNNGYERPYEILDIIRGAPPENSPIK